MNVQCGHVIDVRVLTDALLYRTFDRLYIVLGPFHYYFQYTARPVLVSHPRSWESRHWAGKSSVSPWIFVLPLFLDLSKLRYRASKILVLVMQ